MKTHSVLTYGKSIREMRVHPKRILRSLFMVVLILFVILNMHVLLNFEPQNQNSIDYNLLEKLRNQRHVAEAHVYVGRNNFQQDQQQYDQNESKLELVIPPNSYNKTFSHHNIPDANLSQIKLEMDRINQEQFVHNLHTFGLSLRSDSVVFVVQVHDRAKYLQILIDSLRNVRDISKTLVIFSHDVYSQDLNDIIKGANFCPIMQIFYPHSAQLHPKEFPGEHPNDCPRNIKKDEAIKKKCNNAHHPDKYGHYREAKYCQTKHHWLWKLQHVFDKLDVMKNYTGHVLLLEEDYYVAPDVISTIQMMHSLRKKDCRDCTMLVAGNYDKTQSYSANSGKVELAHWISSRHNMGMTFSRKLWNEIRKCTKEYCLFDDYNWDWTLQHLSMKCIPGKVRVMKMKATRVFHMGECGVHHKGKNCNPEVKKKQVETQLSTNKKFLFPNVLSISGSSKLKLRDPKPNGGWGDIRDRNLCLSLVDDYPGKPPS